MQMGETIVIIVIVMILIIVGIVFWQNIESGEIKAKSRKFADMDAIDLLNTISSMPEFQCSKKEVVEATCLDEMKLNAFIAYGAVDNAYYSELFSSSVIKLSVVYPEDDDTELVIYDSGEPLVYKGFDVFLVPASLYDPVEKRYEFAVLNIKKYK